ncbi:MAG: DUF21 domain-containing protein [Elusimicrobia bacterium]|nr:DUF21 domain-containing protein [Elusimicrobiota bacterium]
MMAALTAGLSLAGFALSNGLETALLTLSFSDEKKLARSLAGFVYGKELARFYQQIFELWRRRPTDFLAVILAAQSFFSILWCVLGLSRGEHLVWTPLAVGAALFLLGELLPKTLARRFPERVVLFFLPPFYGFFVLFRHTVVPLASFVERLTNWHLPGLKYPLTKKEIKALLADPELSSDLRPRSRFILESLLEFSSHKVRQAMRLSGDVFVLDMRQTQSKVILEQVSRQAYSRVPVSSDGTLANIIGILHARDLLFAYATSGLIRLQDILRACPVVHEDENLASVMERFRQGGVHIALVKDKAGAVKGIISLEDVLEEIVGEIKDEFK